MDDQRRCDAPEGVYVWPGADSVFADLIHGHIVVVSNGDLIQVPRGFDNDVGLWLNEINWNRVRQTSESSRDAVCEVRTRWGCEG